MKSGIRIADAMTINPVSVSADTTLIECSKIMREKHVGAVVVGDWNSLGMLTDQDIVRKQKADKSGNTDRRSLPGLRGIF